MRIAYCGYDFFHGALKELLDRGHVLVELFTFPVNNEHESNQDIFDLAQRAKARITLSPITRSDLERLKTLNVELLLSAGYPYKIPEWRTYVQYALNVHPSPLPEGRGPWPFPWMILKGFSAGTVTIHEISDLWDQGDIVARVDFSLCDQDTLESLEAKCRVYLQQFLPSVLDEIEARWASRVPQKEGSYWLMPQPTDRTIRWDMNIEQIERIIRAFSNPNASIYLDGVCTEVRIVAAWKAEHKLPPGSVAMMSHQQIVYAAADGYVCLSDVSGDNVRRK